MKKHLLAIITITLCTMLAGCSPAAREAGIRQETSSYEEKAVDVNMPLRLSVDCDYAEIETYSWDREQVKFEITRRVRGNLSKQKLADRLDKLETKITKKDNTVSITGSCRLKYADYPDCCLQLRIYTPRSMKNMDYKLKKGTIKLLDNVKCDVAFAVKDASLEINSLEGKISYKGDAGTVRIFSGILYNGSNIQVGRGNVDIKASCKAGGDYQVNALSGFIKLELPSDINATFDYPGSDQLNRTKDPEGGGSPAKFRLKSGIGRIEINRT